MDDSIPAVKTVEIGPQGELNRNKVRETDFVALCIRVPKQSVRGFIELEIGGNQG